MIYPATSQIWATMNDYNQHYCVYEHWTIVNETDVEPTLIYIGSCRLADLFTFPDARRNTEWNKMVHGNTSIFTRLTHVGGKLDCFNQMSIAVKQSRPHCNICGYDGTATQKIRCNETGEIFNNQMAIVKTHNVTISALSNHLARKPGHKTVKGRTYERINS